jgi:hypothetical protein
MHALPMGVKDEVMFVKCLPLEYVFKVLRLNSAQLEYSLSVYHLNMYLRLYD